MFLKKSVTLVAILGCIIQTSLSAAQNQLTKRFTFIDVLQYQKGCVEMPTIIKKVDQDKLVILDSQSWLFIYDLAKAQTIKENKYHTPSENHHSYDFKNIFLFTDGSEEILIAPDALYHFIHIFDLDGKTIHEKSSSMVDYINNLSYEQSISKDIVATEIAISRNQKPRLLENMFDIETMPIEAKNKLISTTTLSTGTKHLTQIWCYHLTTENILYCAHSRGLVSIWHKE